MEDLNLDLSDTAAPTVNAAVEVTACSLEQAPGCSREQVEQSLNPSLNLELTYSEKRNSEFSVLDQLL